MVDETARAYGIVDVLVNSAARAGENGPFLEVSPATWEEVLAVNLTGVFLCSQAAGRVMARAGGGSFNVSSTNGLVPQPRWGSRRWDIAA